jgi:hypothetical protein
MHFVIDFELERWRRRPLTKQRNLARKWEYVHQTASQLIAKALRLAQA